jgi:putative Holliday junction resolvase
VPEPTVPELTVPEPKAPGPAALEPASRKRPDGAATQLILAFDYGRKRIGAACGDTASRTASPLGAVSSDAAGPRWEAIDALMRDWQPAMIVVGLPYNVDDSESALTAAARGFAHELAERYAVRVELIDERYSSLEAETRLKTARELGLRKRRVAKGDVDAVAACIILERWFTEKT